MRSRSTWLVIIVVRFVGLKGLDKGHHALALIGVGQAATHCAEIVRHVRRIGSAGNDRSYPRVAQQVFEEELGPA